MEAYRTHGHKAAKINPLLPDKPVADTVPEINMLTDSVTGTLQTSGKKEHTHARASMTSQMGTDNLHLRNF